MQFPAGTNTGRGKPANFTFTQFMKLVLAFELVQSGLAPSTAAFIVTERWDQFGAAFARTMVDDREVEDDPAAFPGSHLMFVIYFDAMWQLGAEGESRDRVEYYGALRVVLPDDIGKTLADEDFTRDIDSPWRTLVIDARRLLITATIRVRQAGLVVRYEEIFNDLVGGDSPETPYGLKAKLPSAPFLDGIETLKVRENGNS